MCNKSWYQISLNVFNDRKWRDFFFTINNIDQFQNDPPTMEDSAFCRPLGQPLYRSNHHRPFPTPPGGRLLLDPRCWWCPLPAVLGLGNCRQLNMKFTLDLFRIHQGYFFFKKTMLQKVVRYYCVYLCIWRTHPPNGRSYFFHIHGDHRIEGRSRCLRSSRHRGK